MSSTHTASSKFITFHEPIKEVEGMIPLCDPHIDFNVSQDLFNCHYKTKWTVEFLERTLLEKILFKHPYEDVPVFSVDIVLKVCHETEDFIEHVKTLPESTLTETPEEYKF